MTRTSTASPRPQPWPGCGRRSRRPTPCSFATPEYNSLDPRRAEERPRLGLAAPGRATRCASRRSRSSGRAPARSAPCGPRPSSARCSRRMGARVVEGDVALGYAHQKFDEDGDLDGRGRARAAAARCVGQLIDEVRRTSRSPPDRPPRGSGRAPRPRARAAGAVEHLGGAEPPAHVGEPGRGARARRWRRRRPRARPACRRAAWRARGRARPARGPRAACPPAAPRRAG